jgi:lipopolysaccharide export system protein LptA
MACKFHAFMNHYTLPSSLVVALAAALAAVLACAPARAERTDRLQKINISADQGGQLDLQNQVVIYTGNVVITQGSMVIRAAKVEVRELPSGYRTAVALGSPGKPATFRQKRDGVDEYIEGEAERLEYDGKSVTVRFINNAEWRRLRGATLADEVSGNLITYDGTTEKMEVSGGAKPTTSNPGGRVGAVLTPREGTEAAAEAAQAAASAASPLKMTPALPPPKTGDKR